MADIAIRNVRKAFGKAEVVHGIALDIANGEFVAILGPSGCGKSTLLRMIAGLESITSGEIAIAGRIVNRLEPRQRGCAMVFQNYALYPHMTVAQNIGYALKVQGVPRAERARRVEETAKAVGLSDFLNRKPGQLSGGQRQRVAMARAIIREPQVFLFDEPLSNLDATLRVAMRLEIRRLHNRLKATSVFVTHDQVEAMTLADKVVVMNKGQIEQTGSPAEIYHRPATRFVATFIGSPPMNLLTAHVSAPGIATIHDGSTLAYDAAAYPVAVGAAVDIGVRPEHFTFSHAGGTGLPFTSELTEELGAVRLIHGHSSGVPVAVALPAVSAEDGGREQRTLIATSGHVHLFDPATGKSLRSKTTPIAIEPAPLPRVDAAVA